MAPQLGMVPSSSTTTLDAPSRGHFQSTLPLDPEQVHIWACINQDTADDDPTTGPVGLLETGTPPPVDMIACCPGGFVATQDLCARWRIDLHVGLFISIMAMSVAVPP